MNDVIAAALTEIEALRIKVSGWRGLADLAARVVAEQAPVIEWRVQCGYSSGSLQGILIIGSEVVDLAHVLPLLKSLRREGFRVDRHEDWQDIPSRTYYLKEVVTDGVTPLTLTVRVCFPWDAEKAASASCRFVQTGTKEVPVMEIVCGGDKTPELTAEVTGA